MSKGNVDFTKNLAKGKIAETIFWMMFRDDPRFLIFPFGYEHLIPELTRFKKLLEDKSQKTFEKISSSPDFILLTADRKKIFLVDVKFRWDKKDFSGVRSDAEKTLERWDECWYFVATPAGFYFDTCKNIVDNFPRIQNLPSEFISEELQIAYLRMLRELVQLRLQKDKKGNILVKTHCASCNTILAHKIGNVCPKCGNNIIDI